MLLQKPFAPAQLVTAVSQLLNANSIEGLASEHEPFGSAWGHKPTLGDVRRYVRLSHKRIAPDPRYAADVPNSFMNF